MDQRRGRDACGGSGCVEIVGTRGVVGGGSPCGGGLGGAADINDIAGTDGGTAVTTVGGSVLAGGGSGGASARIELTWSRARLPASQAIARSRASRSAGSWMARTTGLAPLMRSDIVT